MKKKILVSLLILFLLAIAGGIFWYSQNQKDVREINKTLPEGVKVAKSLFGKDYTVVNKIDGYEFKVPEAWNGIKEIEYISEVTESGYTASSIDLEGAEGGSTVTVINKFIIEDRDVELKNWAESFFKIFGLIGEFSGEKIGEFEIMKTTEEKHLVGMYVVFFRKNQTIYRIINGSEEFIQEIILNGKW